MACTRVAAAAIVGGAQPSRLYVGSSSSSSSSAASGGRRLGCSNGSRVSMAAQWLPGQPRPSYLDGSAPGDFGFDPLGLGEVPENLERYKESELIHCRWAMLAIVSLLFSINCCLPLLGLFYLDFSNSHTESSWNAILINLYILLHSSTWVLEVLVCLVIIYVSDLLFKDNIGGSLEYCCQRHWGWATG
jgi:hypothetical protein